MTDGLIIGGQPAGANGSPGAETVVGHEELLPDQSVIG